MTNQNTPTKPQAIQTVPKNGEIEYIGFGGDTRVKLSAKIVQTYLCKPTRKGNLCSEQDAIRFMMLCQARALNPFEGDAFLVGYDGQNGPEFSMITAIQAFLKRAEVSAEYDGMQSGIIVHHEETGLVEDIEGEIILEGQKLLGGWAIVFKKNQKYPTKRRLPLSAFAKDNKFWNGNPGGMICKCAEADALRAAFPTKLGGLYVREEMPAEERGFSNAKQIQQSPSALLENPEPVTRVDFTQSEAEPVPVQSDPPKERAANEAPSAVTQLIEFVVSQGFTADDLFFWAKSGGHIDNAKITADQFPVEVAQRLLRAKQGMVKGLNQFRSEVVK